VLRLVPFADLYFGRLNGRLPTVAIDLKVAMKKLLAAAVVCLSLPGLSAAEIYRCTDGNGRAVFSQSSCGADAVEVVIEDRRVGSSSSGARPAVDYAALNRQIDKRTRISSLKRDIHALQLEKQGLRQERA